jgi:hypothetical protein
MIRRCEDGDSEVIWAIINDGAQAYKGVIPADQWTERKRSLLAALCRRDATASARGVAILTAG